jgi:hypothetical protein
MMQLTPEQRIARHKDFLNANWESLAAFAWEHHQAEGAGVVLVPEDDFVHFESPQMAPLRFHYLSLAASERPPFKNLLSEKELTWLRTYDPDTHVVCCIIQDGGVSSYLFSGSCRCSEAYLRQKAKSN